MLVTLALITLRNEMASCKNPDLPLVKMINFLLM